MIIGEKIKKRRHTCNIANGKGSGNLELSAPHLGLQRGTMKKPVNRHY